MNEAEFKYRSCLRKKKLSKIAADLTIERIAKESKKVLYYYSCQFCGRYHLTKREPYTKRSST